MICCTGNLMRSFEIILHNFHSFPDIPLETSASKCPRVPSDLRIGLSIAIGTARIWFIKK